MHFKAIMVDVDGVLLVHPDTAGWKVHLERDLGLSVKKVQQLFFEVHWDDIVCGRADLRDRLEPVLNEIAPNVSCNEFIDYWFSNDAHVDHALIKELMLLRKRGIKIHLATVQEHERARYLWEGISFRAQFDAMHYAASLGCAKPDIEFFKRIEDRTGLASADIFFIDDKIANVEAANCAGWAAALWKPGNRLRDLLIEFV